MLLRSFASGAWLSAVDDKTVVCELAVDIRALWWTLAKRTSTSNAAATTKTAPSASCRVGKLTKRFWACMGLLLLKADRGSGRKITVGPRGGAAQRANSLFRYLFGYPFLCGYDCAGHTKWPSRSCRSPHSAAASGRSPR